MPDIAQNTPSNIFPLTCHDSGVIFRNNCFQVSSKSNVGIATDSKAMNNDAQAMKTPAVVADHQ